MKKEKLKKLSLKLTADRENYMSAFRHNVDMYVAEKDIKLREIAEEADIPFSTLNTFLYGDASDCKLSTAVKLARAFDVSIDELVGAETINAISKESLAICRNLPEHSLYLIRHFIRHQESIYGDYKQEQKIISVLTPECANGHLLTTNVVAPLCIDHLADNIKSRVSLGMKIPCEHYMPYFSPYDTLLLAADRDGLHGEKCVISYKGNFFIVIKQFYMEDGQRKIKYVSLINQKTEVFPHEIDDKLGYIVGYLNPDGSWGIR